MPTKSEIDKLYLDLCKEQIQTQLGWGDPESWVHGDFVKLSELIFDESKIRISINTLKRLWNKIPYDSYPNQSTRDALAKTIGFADFEEFRKANAEKISFHSSSESQSENNSSPENIIQQVKSDVLFETKPKKKSYVFTLLFVGFLISIWTVFWVTNKKVPKDLVVKISSSNNIKVGWPHTVTFNLDVMANEGDSLVVNYHSDIFETISSKTEKLNYTYYMPNYYQLRVLKAEKEIAKLPVHIKTKGWEAFGPLDTEISFFPQKLNDTIKDGLMYIPPAYLNKTSFSLPKEFLVSYRNIDDFQFSVDSLTIKTRVKSSTSLGGLPCHDFMLRLVGEKEPVTVQFQQKACVDEAFVSIGKEKVTGRMEDLSSFGLDFEEWQDIEVVLQGGTIKILANNQIVFSREFKTSLGKLKGIIFWFKGTGAVDEVSLSDSYSGKMLYQEPFDEIK